MRIDVRLPAQIAHQGLAHVFVGVAGQIRPDGFIRRKAGQGLVVFQPGHGIGAGRLECLHPVLVFLTYAQGGPGARQFAVCRVEIGCVQALGGQFAIRQGTQLGAQPLQRMRRDLEFEFDFLHGLDSPAVGLRVGLAGG
ncbi:MAG: hypothetical protein QM742_02455 [Aquabacterium sp.]